MRYVIAVIVVKANLFLNLLLEFGEANFGEEVFDFLVLRSYSVGGDGSAKKFDLGYSKVTFFDG